MHEDPNLYQVKKKSSPVQRASILASTNKGDTTVNEPVTSQVPLNISKNKRCSTTSMASGIIQIELMPSTPKKLLTSSGGESTHKNNEGTIEATHQDYYKGKTALRDTQEARPSTESHHTVETRQSSNQNTGPSETVEDELF
jgi:hypothetical protein